MNSHTQTFSYNRPAPAARLAGVLGRNRNHLPTSFFRFVSQYAPELAQRSVVRGECAVSIGCHKAKCQVLDANEVVLVHQLTGYFVPEITPLVGYLTV